jgi:hypothetical protein
MDKWKDGRVVFCRKEEVMKGRSNESRQQNGMKRKEETKK